MSHPGQPQYGVPQPNQSQYGAPQQNQVQYGGPQQSQFQYGVPPQNQFQYGEPPQYDLHVGLPPYKEEPRYCPPPPPQPPPSTQIVYQTVGNCPACRQGNLQANITCLGVYLAIFFFPVGLICLFLLQEQRCSHCGYCTTG